MIAFCPTTLDDLRAARAAGGLTGAGFAPTPSMLAAHGLAKPDDEDAAFTAQTYAAMASLGWAPRRTIVAVETNCDVTDDEWGLVSVAATWRQVRAIFRDGDDALGPVAEASAIMRSGGWQAVWDDDRIQALVDHDLLWYDPSELDQLED